MTDPKALAEALAYFRPSPMTKGPVMLTPEKMRAHLAVIETALRAPSAEAMRGMKTELRPFEKGDRPGLDEIVCFGSTFFHAEMMSDNTLWLGISDEAQGLIHAWISIQRHQGRNVLVMTATDAGCPTILSEAKKALPLTPERS